MCRKCAVSGSIATRTSYCIEVEQVGGIACHTGRHSCFFQKLVNGEWVATDPVMKDPQSIYRK